MRKKEHFDNETLNKSVTGGSTDSILGALYRDILITLGVTTMAFNSLMEHFLNDPVNGIPANLKERSSARGNLRKELLRGYMTWKVFCKGIRFLCIPKFTISICLHHRNGKKTFHQRTVIIDELFIDPTAKSEDNNPS